MYNTAQWAKQPYGSPKWHMANMAYWFWCYFFVGFGVLVVGLAFGNAGYWSSYLAAHWGLIPPLNENGPFPKWSFSVAGVGGITAGYLWWKLWKFLTTSHFPYPRKRS